MSEWLRIDKNSNFQHKGGKMSEQLTSEREKGKAAIRHMEACRSLLRVPDDDVLYQAIKDLNDQLAVEREKVRALGEALKEIRAAGYRLIRQDNTNVIDEALAKVKEAK